MQSHFLKRKGNSQHTLPSHFIYFICKFFFIHDIHDRYSQLTQSCRKTTEGFGWHHSVIISLLQGFTASSQHLCMWWIYHIVWAWDTQQGLWSNSSCDFLFYCLFSSLQFPMSSQMSSQQKSWGGETLQVFAGFVGFFLRKVSSLFLALVWPKFLFHGAWGGDLCTPFCLLSPWSAVIYPNCISGLQKHGGLFSAFFCWIASLWLSKPCFNFFSITLNDFRVMEAFSCSISLFFSFSHLQQGFALVLIF